MAITSPKLEWCIVKLGQDLNWWVEKISNPVLWDVHDGVSIIDPRQINYIIECASPLLDYGLSEDAIDQAFFKFRIKEDLGNGLVKLERVRDSLFGSTDPLFALPDNIDEDTSPYSELLDKLIRARIKMLNDLIEFEEQLSIDELEEELWDKQNATYMEGKPSHVFNELMAIIDYIPEGYELELEDKEPSHSDDDPLTDVPDVEEDEIEQDETMRWGDEEDHKDDTEENLHGFSKDDEDDDFDDEDDDFDDDFDDDDEDEDFDDDDEEDDDEDDYPRRSSSKKSPSKPAPKSPSKKTSKSSPKPASNFKKDSLLQDGLRLKASPSSPSKPTKSPSPKPTPSTKNTKSSPKSSPSKKTSSPKKK